MLGGVKLVLVKKMESSGRLLRYPYGTFMYACTNFETCVVRRTPQAQPMRLGSLRYTLVCTVR